VSPATFRTIPSTSYSLTGSTNSGLPNYSNLVRRYGFVQMRRPCPPPRDNRIEILCQEIQSNTQNSGRI
jgi:hypothetical protein